MTANKTSVSQYYLITVPASKESLLHISYIYFKLPVSFPPSTPPHPQKQLYYTKMQSHFHTVNSLTKKNGIRPTSKLEISHSKHSLREYNIKTMLKLNLYLNLSKLLQENLGSSNQKQLHFPKLENMFKKK